MDSGQAKAQADQATYVPMAMLLALQPRHQLIHSLCTYGPFSFYMPRLSQHGCLQASALAASCPGPDSKGPADKLFLKWLDVHLALGQIQKGPLASFSLNWRRWAFLLSACWQVHWTKGPPTGVPASPMA